MIKVRYKTVIFISYIISLVSGFLLHFAYNFFNNNLIVGLFTPVNESVTEHLKLVSLPFTIFTIFFYFYTKKKFNNIFLLSFIGNILGTLTTTILFYLWMFIFKTHNPIFSIVTYILGVTIAFIIFYLGIYNINLFESTNNSKILGISSLIILAAFYLINTIHPLKIPINKDPITGTYGIFKLK